MVQVDSTYLLSADMDSEELLDLVRAAYPTALISGFGADLAVLKGSVIRAPLTDAWGLAKASGLAGRRAYPDGHRVGGDAVGLPSLHRRPRTVPGAQRIFRQPRHHPPRAAPGRCGVRQRERHRGGRPVRGRTAGRRPRCGDRTQRPPAPAFDGFYTLLVSDHDSFAVVRDAIACKPAVIAETADWVAMASEYRALAGLPGVEQARIWEPEPEVVYAWTR